MDSIYDRLIRMAVTQARVVDPRTVTGSIVIDIDADRWLQDPTAGSLGYFGLYVAKNPPTEFRDNVLLAVTRFVVDTDIDVSFLFYNIEREARALPEWMEQDTQFVQAEMDPTPALYAEAGRHESGCYEGAALQSGCYRDPDAGWLFTATKYVAYQRANVVYLLQCTATSASQESETWRELTAVVRSARFEG